MLTNSPFVLSREGCNRGCGETGQALRKLVVQPHEEEVCSQPGEWGEQDGSCLGQVCVRSKCGSRQWTQLLPIALCHPLQQYLHKIAFEFNLSPSLFRSVNKTHPLLLLLVVLQWANFRNLAPLKDKVWEGFQIAGCHSHTGSVGVGE